MKKFLIIGCTVLLGLSSCTNDFLKEEMVSTITQDYFDTPVGVESLVAGTHEVLRFRYQWTHGPWLFHVGTDAEIQGSNSVDMYNVSAYSPATGDQVMGGRITYLMNTGMYPFINNTNRAIYNLREGVVDLGDQTNRRLSEALFNRAFAYYLLVTQLGDVPMPLMYTTSLPPTFYTPKESSENIYKRLIADVRFAYDNLPTATTIGAAAERNNRITKGAAAHFLARLYLQRAQAAEFANSSEAHLKMLYKGSVATDLDSCIYFASQVIGSGDYELAADFADLYDSAFGAYPPENNREIILAAGFGAGNQGANGANYGMRMQGYFTANYPHQTWGVPSTTWRYGSRNTGFKLSDWGYDVFTDKTIDSRFEKSFQIEYVASRAVGAEDLPYYAYNTTQNTTQTWTAENAAYFNANILPAYDRESWGGRQAVAGEHKIGTGDLGLVFLENSKETAIDIQEAKAQPYVLYPRWVKDGDKYYYRLYGYNNFEVARQGLDGGGAELRYPGVDKFIDLNRPSIDNEQGTRDVTIFRLAQTYLLRAEAYGRKGDFASAIADINQVRARAAYKPANNEVRAEVIARLYPGAENLSAGERKYPYTVTEDKANAMAVDESYWDGASDKSKAENYPPTATTNLQRFVHFIYNEWTRESIGEQVLYEGIHHAGIQYDRVQYHQQMGSSLKEAYWPVADNSSGGLGQNGVGKGFFQPFHTFRPWPQAFLNMLANEDGTPLDDAAKQAYQNPGYR